MKITVALAKLQTLKDRHGDVDVYFDCPKCGQSFAPSTAVAVAVHLSEGKKS